MGPRITLRDLQSVIERKALDIRLVPPIQPIEIQILISLIHSTLFLAARYRQLHDKASRSEAFLFVSDPNTRRRFFDFSDLTRTEIIRILEAGSGFEPDICERFLEALEEHIGGVIDARGQLEVEKFGLFEKRADEGYQLQLVEL